MSNDIGMDIDALPRYMPHAKAERLVAVTRLLLAVYAVVAGVLTGMQREPRGRFAVAMLIAWLLLASIVWIRARSDVRIGAAAGRRSRSSISSSSPA